MTNDNKILVQTVYLDANCKEPLYVAKNSEEIVTAGYEGVVELDGVSVPGMEVREDSNPTVILRNGASAEGSRFGGSGLKLVVDESDISGSMVYGESSFEIIAKKSRLFDFEIRDSSLVEGRLLETYDDTDFPTEGCRVEIKRCNGNYINVTRSRVSGVIENTDLRGSVFYKSFLSLSMHNVKLFDVDFLGIRFSPSSKITVSNTASPSYRSIAEANFYDCEMPVDFYEFLKEAGAKIDNVRVIEDSFELFDREEIG